MKWNRFCSAVIAFAVSLPALCAAAADDVFPVKLTAQDASPTTVTVQFPSNLVFRAQFSSIISIKPLSLTTDDLVNLARGRPRNAPVPTNEVLALVLRQMPGVPQLVVFDTDNSSNLVTILEGSETNEFDILRVVEFGSKDIKLREDFITVVDVVSSGNTTNGINGGFLTISGKTRFDLSREPIVQVLSAVSGALNLRMTGDTGTHDVTVLIPRGSLTTQGAPLVGPGVFWISIVPYDATSESSAKRDYSSVGTP